MIYQLLIVISICIVTLYFFYSKVENDLVSNLCNFNGVKNEIVNIFQIIIFNFPTLNFTAETFLQ